MANWHLNLGLEDSSKCLSSVLLYAGALVILCWAGLTMVFHRAILSDFGPLAAIHGVAKSRARLSDFTFIFHFQVLEKEMATHSSVLAWRIPGTGEPGGCRLWGHTESDTTEVIEHSIEYLEKHSNTVQQLAYRDWH